MATIAAAAAAAAAAAPRLSSSASSSSSSQRIVHAYRHLYRAFLRAVQYSTPARHVVRDRLRAAFRPPHGGDAAAAAARARFNPVSVRRTLTFLEYAARHRGVEHRILKNLLHIRYYEYVRVHQRPK
jgi:hypothetical protein